jgi:hypothetical protein
MKTENIIWGLILVFIGGVLLLDNFNVIDFYWRSVWRLWPLILVISGANIIFSGNHSKSGALIAIIITIGALGFIGYYGTRPQSQERGWGPHINIDVSDDDENKPETHSRSSFSEPYQGTQRAVLNISGGATVYTLEDTTSNLFDADVDQGLGRYSLQKVSQNGMEVLNFKMQNKNKDWNFDDENGNEARLKLNGRPAWDINVKTGAGETNFDLTSFKIANLTFKGGAASFKAKLGEPVTSTNVNIETGVAEVKLSVPSSVGCRIKVDSGLSSKNFESFTQQSDGTYISPNYSSAAKKININLKGGLSEFEVTRY